MFGPDREAYYRFFEERPKSFKLTDENMFALMVSKYGLKEAVVVQAAITAKMVKVKKEMAK